MHGLKRQAPADIVMKTDGLNPCVCDNNLINVIPNLA